MCHLNIPEIEIRSCWTDISVSDRVLNDCSTHYLALAVKTPLRHDNWLELASLHFAWQHFTLLLLTDFDFLHEVSALPLLELTYIPPV